MSYYQETHLIQKIFFRMGSIMRGRAVRAGMHFPEEMVCNHLAHNEAMSKDTQAKDLAALLYVSKPAISKLLNIMEKKGLIIRERRDINRRAVYVVLTDAARGRIEKLKAEEAVIIQRVIEKIGTENAKKLVELTRLYCDAYNDIAAQEGGVK